MNGSKRRYVSSDVVIDFVRIGASSPLRFRKMEE